MSLDIDRLVTKAIPGEGPVSEAAYYLTASLKRKDDFKMFRAGGEL